MNIEHIQENVSHFLLNEHMVEYFYYYEKPLSYITSFEGHLFYHHFIEEIDANTTEEYSQKLSFIVPIMEDERNELPNTSIREFLLAQYNKGNLYLLTTIFTECTGFDHSNIHKVTEEDELNIGLPFIDFYFGLGTSV